MRQTEIERLGSTGDKDSFLAKVLDDFGAEGSFTVEISRSVQSPKWLQGNDVSDAARLLADEIGASVERGAELLGRRYRFNASNSGSTVDLTVVRIRANGLEAFYLPA